MVAGPPGGWCDVNESPADAVVRETQEESGLEVRAIRLLALLDKHKHPHPPQLPHALKAFFFCHVTGAVFNNKRTKRRRPSTSRWTPCRRFPSTGYWPRRSRRYGSESTRKRQRRFSTSPPTS
ncbi:NUDIX domain-containing protein [Pseudomonas aeruginosa]|uniref:NUDIX domain-containing protein n=1 Tax=Pseudomonas aeruginosa TaxID=287 RepID=UPI0034A320E2